MASHNFVNTSIKPLELGAFLATSITLLLIANTKSKKGKNFVDEKDFQLCKSYLQTPCFPCAYG
jgi:hypothetical protein